MRLSFVCEVAQIWFETIVDGFGLTIGMEMIGSAEMKLGSPKPEQFFLEIAYESWIIVRDNILGNSMVFEYIVHENLSHYGIYKWVLEGT